MFCCVPGIVLGANIAVRSRPFSCWPAGRLRTPSAGFPSGLPSAVPRWSERLGKRQTKCRPFQTFAPLPQGQWRRNPLSGRSQSDIVVLSIITSGVWDCLVLRPGGPLYLGTAPASPFATHSTSYPQCGIRACDHYKMLMTAYLRMSLPLRSQ